MFNGSECGHRLLHLAAAVHLGRCHGTTHQVERMQAGPQEISDPQQHPVVVRGKGGLLDEPVPSCERADSVHNGLVLIRQGKVHDVHEGAILRPCLAAFAGEHTTYRLNIRQLACEILNALAQPRQLSQASGFVLAGLHLEVEPRQVGRRKHLHDAQLAENSMMLETSIIL